MPTVEILGVRLGWKVPPAHQSQPGHVANPGTSRTVSQSHPLPQSPGILLWGVEQIQSSEAVGREKGVNRQGTERYEWPTEGQ